MLGGHQERRGALSRTGFRAAIESCPGHRAAIRPLTGGGRFAEKAAADLLSPPPEWARAGWSGEAPAGSRQKPAYRRGALAWPGRRAGGRGSGGAWNWTWTGCSKWLRR